MNQQPNNATSNAAVGKYFPPSQRFQGREQPTKPGKPVAEVPPKAEDFPELASRKLSSTPPTEPKAMSWVSVVAKKEAFPPPTMAEMKEKVDKPRPKRLVAKRFGSKTLDTAVKEEKLTPKRVLLTKPTNVAFDEDWDNDEDDEYNDFDDEDCE